MPSEGHPYPHPGNLVLLPGLPTQQGKRSFPL